MLERVKQSQNHAEGDIVAGDKKEVIIDNSSVNIEVHNIANIERKRLIDELAILLTTNFSDRIALHKHAYDQIVSLRNSGDFWWLDEADYVFDALHQIGDGLDKHNDYLLSSIKDLSPKIYLFCKELIEFEKEKRSVMKGYLMMPEDRLKRDMGFTFDDRYAQILDDLEKGVQHLQSLFADLSQSY